MQGKHRNIQGTADPGLRKAWLIYANSCTVIFCSYDCNCGVFLTRFSTQASLSFTGLFTFSVFLVKLCSRGGLTDDWSLQVCIWQALLSHHSLRLALLQLPRLLQPESRYMTWQLWASKWNVSSLMRLCSAERGRFTLKWPVSIPATQPPVMQMKCICQWLGHFSQCGKMCYWRPCRNINGNNEGIEGGLQCTWSEVREKAS